MVESWSITLSMSNFYILFIILYKQRFICHLSDQNGFVKKGKEMVIRNE